jgi:hypothetical protein
LGEIGSLISEKKLSEHFKLKSSKDPVWLTEKLVFLGEIERKNDFEAKSPIGKIVKPNFEEDDYLMDDSALAYKSPRGLVIITSCSHAGICSLYTLIYLKVRWQEEPTLAPDVLIKHEKVIYGISPYQDTILPRVAEKLGWDTEENKEVRVEKHPKKL